MRTARRALRWGAIAGGLLLAAGIAAPFIHANRFKAQIEPAVERAIGRDIEFEAIRFTLLTGPGFALDKVVIHEDPAISAEPVAYVTTLRAGIRLWPLWTGRLEFSSIDLDEPSINLAKSDRAEGAWNFESLLQRTDLSRFPEVRIRSGRINFKFGESKSTLYLMNADASLSPPSKPGGAWSIRFEGAPARTDRRSRGFGGLLAYGRWQQGGHIDLNLRLDRNALADLSSALGGHDAGVHGELSARVRLSGPLNDIRITGETTLEDIHRWDMLPTDTAGWPFRLTGHIDATAQRFDLEAVPAADGVPVIIRARASHYLSAPQWGVSVTWKKFPVEPLLDVARHMGVALPGNLRVAGWVEGAVGYSASGGMQGEVGFFESRVETPGSSPLQFEQARLLFDGGSVLLLPATVVTAEAQRASVEGRWEWGSRAWEFRIATKSMDVGALRAQSSLVSVPWIEQLQSGNWSGELRYDFDPGRDAATGWSGRLAIRDALVPVPGVAEPVLLKSAHVSIQGYRVELENMRVRVGDLAGDGEYRYEPKAPRPHRFRLAVAEADAGELERLLAPSLRRRGGLLARALRFGRAPVPDWMTERRAEGSLSFGALSMGDLEFLRVRTRVVWEGTGIELSGLQAQMGPARVEGGGGTIGLRGSIPVYQLHARWAGAEWQAGSMAGQSILRTSGSGPELLANLRSSGIFHGHGLIMAAGEPARVNGAYEARWSPAGPRIRLAALRVSTPAQTYSGRGRTTVDGRLVVELTSGERELRMTGTLAKLNMETPSVP